MASGSQMNQKTRIRTAVQLSDSRRLTGPNLILDGPGAAAEIAVDEPVRDQALTTWQAHARQILDAVDWQDEHIATRLYDGGATLAITAPMDALYVATEIVEAAWEMTAATVKHLESPDFEAIIDSLRAEIKAERCPALINLQAAAEDKGLALVPDDDTISIGLGKGSQSWPRRELPDSHDVDWDSLSNIPVGFVTGTNGKSTTVRLAAAMGAAAGKTVGFSSSDWVKAGTDQIASGDYSGPEGARLALRDDRVEIAVIETARGGLLRRGLPLPNATACLITNVAADHLGDYGILDVDALADTKFTIAKAVRESGTLILNADDARLKSRGEAFAGTVAWYGLGLTQSDIPAKGLMGLVHDGTLTLVRDGEIEPILPVADFGPALGGVAEYNISNALGAIVMMSAMGLPPAPIRQGLLDFGSTVEDNPGRGNFIELGGVKLLLDFAHNPHGLTALTRALGRIPAKRRLYLCGQGGDRSNADIFELTRVIRDADPEAIIVKEIPGKLRGRDPGEVPALITQYLGDLDYPADQIHQAGSEYDAAVMALEWARPGDLLVLLVYDQRTKTLELIDKLMSEGWQAGDPVNP